MLDYDLASFYETETRTFNQAMKRKKEDFGLTVFRLTKEEFDEILFINKETKTTQYNPYAYTEKAAYKMAFILSNKNSIKVADLILDVFISVRDGKYVPQLQDNKIAVLEHKVALLEIQMKGKQIQNNFHGPVSLIQGQNISMGVKEEVILSLIDIMRQTEVVSNQKLTELLSKSIDQANKKDSKGLLETLKTLTDIGSGVSTISTQIPNIIKLITDFFL